jgi:hypothetical protein
MAVRDIEYHKMINRTHILPNFLNGAKFGVISQFISDIVLSLLLYNETLIINDINVSKPASYYAAAASGGMIAFLSIYMDPFAIVLFSNITYDYVYELVSNDLNYNNLNIRPREIVFDTALILILTYLFDPTAHNQYLRYKQKREGIEPTYGRQDRPFGLTIFFLVLVNTYNFLKIVNPDDNTNENKNNC